MQSSEISTELVANFSGITGADTVDAIKWLEIGGYILEDAVGLYFSNQQDASQSLNHVNEQYDSRSSGHSSSQGIPSHSYNNDLDEIRQPDRVKRQRLVEDTFSIVSKYL